MFPVDICTYSLLHNLGHPGKHLLVGWANTRPQDLFSVHQDEEMTVTTVRGFGVGKRKISKEGGRGDWKEEERGEIHRQGKHLGKESEEAEIKGKEGGGITKS